MAILLLKYGRTPSGDESGRLDEGSAIPHCASPLRLLFVPKMAVTLVTTRSTA